MAVMRKFLRYMPEQWARSRSGTIAVYMAVILPVLIGSIGMCIDLAQTYLVRERLSKALDAAALAVAGSTQLETEAEMLARVNEFMEANYPAEKIGTAYNIDIAVNGNDVTVSASADYDTLFMNVLGVDQITVDSRSSVRKQIKGVEAVLVLDNTGSMSYTPPGESMSNIQALRTAAASFVDIMYNNAREADDVRIGIVPYANAVRIGTWGLGYIPDGTATMTDNAPYLDADGVQVTPFVTLPSGVSYTTSSSSSTGWYGCVVEHHPDYDSAATHVSGSYGQLWQAGGLWDGHGWNAASGTNDPSPSDQEDSYEGPWDIYMYGRIIGLHSRCSTLGSGYSNTASNCSNCTVSWGGNSNTCASTYCYCKYSSPANSCPRTTVLPLTSVENDLNATINAMQAHGNTQGNAGMIWGYRMISPEPPFTEGSEWGSERWTKAVIMMTDGDNTMDGTYSYHWASAKNDIVVDKGTAPLGLNQRFSEVCDALKAQEPPVLIYTIVFKSENEVSAANKQFYEDCATNPSMYFDAPTQADLQQTFRHIAQELSNLHLTE